MPGRRGGLAPPAAVRCGAAALIVLLLAACRAVPDVAIERTTVISWPDGAGGTAGQVIVQIRNDGTATVDADVFGRGEQTVAVLRDASGAEFAGARPIQLDAVPQTLEPGERGYLLATFVIDDADVTVADAEVQLNPMAADPRPRPGVVDVEVVPGDGGLAVTGRLDWDGTGSAVGRAVALDAAGRPIGYVATDEVRYAAGEISMCCFPPGVVEDDIADIDVFGILLRDEPVTRIQLQPLGSGQWPVIAASSFGGSQMP
jgi:hypothetical protein